MKLYILIIFILSYVKLYQSSSEVNLEHAFSNNTEAQNVKRNLISRATVIVWEKCGIEAKTRITKIFEGQHHSNEFAVFYDPTINALIFEVQYNKILNTTLMPLNDNVDTLFFTFEEPGRITILGDCHTADKLKLKWSSEILEHKFTYQTYQHVLIFPSLENARKIFMCRTLITITPGSILHLTGTISNLGNTLLLTFTHLTITFSVTYENGVIIILTSDSKMIKIDLEKSFSSSGIFLIFDENGISFFNKCPHENLPIGFWNTTIFTKLVQIETTKIHYIGSVVSAALLKSFCITDKYIDLENKNKDLCIPIKDLTKDLEIVQGSNKITHNYLPSKEQMEKIESVSNLNIINVGSLITLTTPKLTIASRYYARPKFFDRSISEYINGFSDGNLNYWIGLEAIHRATTMRKFGLRIELELNGIIYSEEFNNVQVGNSSEKYQLRISGPRIGDKTQHFINHNGLEFSTYDYGRVSFAQQNAGGFWFRPSYIANNYANTYFYYCFSCENRVDASGTATFYWPNTINAYITRMQLLL